MLKLTAIRPAEGLGRRGGAEGGLPQVALGGAADAAAAPVGGVGRQAHNTG